MGIDLLEESLSPKVSIIMPSLNVVSYIESAIRSVLQQTLAEVEIICIDAGSTDGTVEIIKKLAQDDHRINVINSEKKSYGYQVNRGIREAKGKYIGIVETDDYVSSNMYETLYNEAQDNDYDFVKCDYSAYWTQKNGSFFHVQRKCLLSDNLYERDINPIEYITLATDDWYLWNGLYKKSFIQENNIELSETSGAAFQDIGFLHETIVRAQKVKYIHGYLYHYCIDREGASSNSNKDLFYAYQEYKLRYKESWESIDEKRFYFARMSESFVLACRNTGNLHERISEVMPYYLWFVEKLRIGIEECIVTDNSMPENIKNDFHQLMDSLETYDELLLRKKQAFRSFIGEVGLNSIVIFGCGNYGCDAYRLLNRNGFKVTAFMDNNSKLWGKNVDGIKIVDPIAAREYGHETRYIIANEKYADEIEKQLNSIVKEPYTFKFSSGLL